MQVNDNLRAEMSRRKISQRQLAKKIGISQPTLSRWLDGDLTLKQIEMLGKVLKIAPRELLKGWCE